MGHVHSHDMLVGERGCDIVTATIVYKLWHITDLIFYNLDAVSLLYCEKVRRVFLYLGWAVY